MLVRAHVYDSDVKPFEMATATNMTTGQTVIADLNGYIELRAGHNDIVRIEAMGHNPKQFKAYAVPPVVYMQASNDELPEVAVTYKKKQNNWVKWALGATILTAIAYQFKNQ